VLAPVGGATVLRAHSAVALRRAETRGRASFAFARLSSWHKWSVLSAPIIHVTQAHICIVMHVQ
jgi:hypothetical protein